MPPIFSPNSHIRHSHYLYSSQPNAPASSVSRGTTGNLRNSLRKIPSSLFAKSDVSKEKTKAENRAKVSADQSRETRQSGPVPLPKSPEGKVKSKTKTRKALGEIFGWGNSHSSHSSASAPPSKAPSLPPKTVPALVKPAPPPPVPTREPMLLRKPPSSRHLPNRSQQSGLSTLGGRTALKPPQEQVNRSRPSMGEDPFGRREEGAEVVEHVMRHGMTPSLTGVGRTGSVTSSKALSTRTAVSDEATLSEAQR